MKTLLKYFFLLAIFFCTLNCSGSSSGTTNVGNSTTTEITISKLTGGVVTVEIPLEAFGDSDADAATTTLAIYQNGVLLASFTSLESDYDPDEDLVSFTLSDLTDGDLITFLFTDADEETIASFAGAVSDDDATTATSTTAAEDLLADANLLIQNMSDGIGADAFSVQVPLSVFGDELDNFTGIDVTSTYSDSTTDTWDWDSSDADLETLIYDETTELLSFNGAISSGYTVDNVETLTIELTGDYNSFSPDIGDNLGVWESTSTLYRLGFVGTGTSSSDITYTLTETGRTVSSGCPGALSSALEVPATMEVEQNEGRFIYVNGADDDRDWEGIVNDDGTFILLDGIVTTDGSLTSTAVSRFDGIATDTAISGTYVVDYDTPSWECRVDVDFVGTL